jgi:FkbH-like protein
VALTDARIATLAGTTISNAAQLLLCRELACHWIPAALNPPIKAVALDLDNTLHQGVLGEDGIEGVKLTSGHHSLQTFIKTLRQRGIFIALVSRNEYSDVEELFAQRDDYPLRWSDFSATEISWGDKAVAISRIAETLRISPDAVLFVDDNIGELASMTAKLPLVQTVYAHQDASITQCAIDYHPGLWRWKLEMDDAKRIEDMKANIQRELLLAEANDPADYFRSLQVSLFYNYDSLDHLSRLADLCNKTNQFNLAIQRFNQAELAERMEQSSCCVASVQMKDRISDSGVIAVIVCVRVDEKIIVEELCISCRALGRKIEDTLILNTIYHLNLRSRLTTVLK